MKTYYPDDADMISGLSEPELEKFTAFIDELEAVIDDWQSEFGNRPYLKPLARGTGLGCWKESYDDGMSAQEAFDADREYWEHDDCP